MNLTLTVVGAIFVAVAILGGGLRVGGVEIARLSIARMIMLALFGLTTMGLGWSVEWATARTTPGIPVPSPAVEHPATGATTQPSSAPAPTRGP